MNTCSHTAQIAEYLDNELSAQQSAQIKAHLPDCKDCQEELQQLQNLSEIFKTASLPTLRPLALEQIHQHLDEHIDIQLRLQAEKGPLKLASWLTAVAAVVLVACSIQLILVQSNVGNTNNTSEFAPSLAWETTTAMLNQRNPADPAVSDEHSLAAWIISDLSTQASSTSSKSIQE